MKFSIVSAILLAGSAFAGDICGSTCAEGSGCTTNEDGPHCCSSNNPADVLECNQGTWIVRNVCSAGFACCCTGSDDLICSDQAPGCGNK